MSRSVGWLSFCADTTLPSFDYVHRYGEAIQELSAGLVDGSIKRKFHVVKGGVEEAPKALPMLFTGGNTGKL